MQNSTHEIMTELHACVVAALENLDTAKHGGMFPDLSREHLIRACGVIWTWFKMKGGE